MPQTLIIFLYSNNEHRKTKIKIQKISLTIIQIKREIYSFLSKKTGTGLIGWRLQNADKRNQKEPNTQRELFHILALNATL